MASLASSMERQAGQLTNTSSSDSVSGKMQISCEQTEINSSFPKRSTEAGEAHDVSRLKTEEDLIDSVFLMCDVKKEGEVDVSMLLERIREIVASEHENSGELHKLRGILHAYCVNNKISMSNYKSGIKHWIQQQRMSYSCDDVGNISQVLPPDMHNITYGSIEDCAEDKHSYNSDLLTRNADLEFSNARLSEVNSELEAQITATEQINVMLSNDLEAVRVQYQSSQMELDKQKVIEEENQELKVRLAEVEERRSLIDAELYQLRKDVSTLEKNNRRLSADLDSQDKELMGYDVSNGKLKADFTTLQALHQQTKADLDKRREDLEQCEARIEQLLDSVEKLIMEKKDLEDLLKYYTDRDECSMDRADRSLLENDRSHTSVVSMMLESENKLEGVCCMPSLRMELEDFVRRNQELPSPFCEKPADSGNVSLDSSSTHSLAPLTPEAISQGRRELRNDVKRTVFEHSQEVRLPEAVGVIEKPSDELNSSVCDDNDSKEGPCDQSEVLSTRSDDESKAGQRGNDEDKSASRGDAEKLSCSDDEGGTALLHSNNNNMDAVSRCNDERGTALLHSNNNNMDAVSHCDDEGGTALLHSNNNNMDAVSRCNEEGKTVACGHDKRNNAACSDDDDANDGACGNDKDNNAECSDDDANAVACGNDKVNEVACGDDKGKSVSHGDGKGMKGLLSRILRVIDVGTALRIACLLLVAGYLAWLCQGNGTRLIMSHVRLTQYGPHPI
ncbi:PREDICTED: lymphoid-restricted membrane protein-like isoform X2 [Priapulus caudatus]|nr:PREDICTED: lymphoid-restricted membrane protein-like isoform X2 [Priapulus caudatus]